jgi:lupus La protein
MLKFNRLAAITKDIDIIAASLHDSHLIDLSDDNLKIRRSPDVPLPENTLEYWQEIKRRTVYLVF